MPALLDAESLIPLLTGYYSLPKPIECKLIGRGFNDHYTVTAGSGEYVFRVYMHKYFISGPDDFRFELDLLAHLRAKGIPVPAPIPNLEGGTLTEFGVADEVRYAALFPFAKGEVVSRDINGEDARSLGRVIASLHAASDEFRTPYPRYHLDMKYLVDEPIRVIEKHFIEFGMGDLSFLRPAAEHLRNRVRTLGTQLPAYGLIHSDLIRQNILHSRATGFTLIDFDHCAFGWRAYDLQNLLTSMKPVRTEILEGYESVRPLTAMEREALPTMATVRRSLWNDGDTLALLPVWGHPPEEGWLKEIRERLVDLAAAPL